PCICHKSFSLMPELSCAPQSLPNYPNLWAQHAAPTKPSLHRKPPLLIPIDNAAACQVVRRKLDRHFVSRENTNKILSHFAGNVRQNLVLVLQLNSEHGVRQRLDDRGHDFNGVLFGISRVALVAFFLVVELLRHILLFSLELRSEERRVGKECRSRWSGSQ